MPSERPLFEREAELRRLSAVVDASSRSEGRAALLVGPAGIGKTRLVEEIAEVARRGGVDVLMATAVSLERDFPFGVALQLFDRYLMGGDGDRWLSGSARLAAGLFDPRDDTGPSSPGDGLFPLLHGLFRLTANLANAQPRLIVIDDVQWADLPSLRFAAYLLHRVDPLPVGLIMTVRPGETVDTERVLAELGAHPSIDVIEPPPLSEAAVRSLVLTSVPLASERFCNACARATAGNPLLVAELLRALPEGVTGSDDDAIRVSRLAPRGITRSVLVRLARLSDGALPFARAVAVMGGSSAVDIAGAVAGIEATRLDAVVDGLVRHSVLERDIDGAVRFTHPIVTQAVESEIPAGELATLHQQAAVALDRRGAAVPQIAAHVMEAPVGSGNWAVDILRDAATRAVVDGAPDTAVRYLRRALAEGVEGDTQAEVLLELGRAEALTADRHAAADLEAAAARFPTGDRRRARALGEAARVHYWGGSVIEAFRCFDAALDCADDSQLITELAAGYTPIAALHRAARGGRVGKLLGMEVAAVVSEADADKASRSGSGTGAAVRRGLLAQAALVAFRRGDDREQVLSLARRAHDNGRLVLDEGAESLNLYVVAGVLMWCDALDEAVALLDQAVDDARVRGSVMGLATASCFRSATLLLLGRINDAIVDARTAIDARPDGWELFAPAAACVLAFAGVELGDVDGAAAALAAFESPNGHGPVPYVAASYLDFSRGVVARAKGDHAVALGHFLAAGRTMEALHLDHPAVVAWRSAAAQAAAATGDVAQAVSLADHEVEIAERIGLPRVTATALASRALLAGGDEQIAMLEAAVERIDQSPAVLEQIRLRVELGAALRRRGRRVAAADRLRNALELAERTGTPALAERARNELRIAGFRPRRGASAGVEALTPAERRVAELAADGASNREIAEALYVTVKTVEYHLGNVYTKCGVRSRGQLREVFAATTEAANADASGESG